MTFCWPGRQWLWPREESQSSSCLERCLHPSQNQIYIQTDAFQEYWKEQKKRKQTIEGKYFTWINFGLFHSEYKYFKSIHYKTIPPRPRKTINILWQNMLHHGKTGKAMPLFDCHCRKKQPFVIARGVWMHWDRGQVQFRTMESDTIHYCDKPAQRDTHSFKQHRQQKSVQRFYLEKEKY